MQAAARAAQRLRCECCVAFSVRLPALKQAPQTAHTRRIPTFVFWDLSHAQDLSLVAKADGDPVGLRGAPLQLVDFRAGVVGQDGVQPAAACRGVLQGEGGESGGGEEKWVEER